MICSSLACLGKQILFRPLFAGSDAGAEHWATIASLIETAKLNGVEPLAYLSDILTRIVNRYRNSQIDDLPP